GRSRRRLRRDLWAEPTGGAAPCLGARALDLRVDAGHGSRLRAGVPALRARAAVDPETRMRLELTAEFRTELRRFMRRTKVVTTQHGRTPERYDLLLMIKAAP